MIPFFAFCIKTKNSADTDRIVLVDSVVHIVFYAKMQEH